ncbi:MAG: hypothetical protein K0V04_09055 [Deltaproteobacteria bacterium]|nr:hypothetical protein [Deltaproteobacteria bacterium]
MGNRQPVSTFDPLATVLLYRDTGVCSRDEGGPAALVDEVTVWVYADGSTLGLVTRRLVVRDDEVLSERVFDDPPLTHLTYAEQARVRFEAGVGQPTTVVPKAGPRWSLLGGTEVRPWTC